MSNVDQGLILQLMGQKKFPIIFQHWMRLCSLFGQQHALQVSKKILETQCAEEIVKMTNQDLLCNFKPQDHQPRKDPKSASSSPGAKEQIKIRKQTEQNIKELKKQNNPKEQRPTEKQKTKSQMMKYLQQYKEFTSMSSQDIQDAVEITFQYLSTSKVIPKENIRSNSEKLQSSGLPKSKKQLFLYLELVDSALYYSSKQHRLRFTQILAIIFFLFKSKNYRISLQILTGQGKSTIVSCLAAILTISGQCVDIVTTSQILAKRDVEQKKKFYDILDLEVAHNFEENQRGPKDCYSSKSIIYGTPHSFQVDILLDQYKQAGTRMKRPFKALIVDEVDSMFVDQKGHQTLLATTYPGFAELIHPMKIIWSKICSYPLFKDDAKIMMVIPIGNDQTITGEARKIMDQVIKDLRIKFQNEIIPQWRMEFINQSLDKWILSAISAAFVLKENEDYLVKNQTIVPIDSKNTGEIQENVHWQNGLHQFLQIKHGLKVSTEGMTSNFISNLGHFDKYKYLFGLTGTLGSRESKMFLVQTYNIQLMKVMPFKERRLEINEGMVLYNEVQWAKYIVDQIKNMMGCERSVLLICQSIHEVNLIKIAVKDIKFHHAQYIMTGEQNFKDSIDSCQLIAATNLAGRGTDLKITQKLNEKGGLHVIIGFMPQNLRVEMQGRGRAGRNGCEGSSELAVNYLRYCESIHQSPEPQLIFRNTNWSNTSEISKLRDKIQEMMMKNDRKTVESLRCKDQMFSIYSKAMNSIPDFQTNRPKQLALQQRWAMFLKKIDNSQKDPKQILQEAKELVNKLVNNSQSYFNPNHQIHRGIKQLCNNNNKGAIGHFKNAVTNTNSTTKIIGQVFFNSCQLNQNPQDRGNIQSCLNGFAKCKSLINEKKERNKGYRLFDHSNQRFVEHYDNYQANREENFQQQINQGPRFQQAPLFKGNFQPINLRNINPQQNQQAEIPRIQIQDAQERILTALQDHIEDIENKIKNVGKDQYVTTILQPSSTILNKIQGDRKENEQALEKLRTQGLELVPVPKICKKKQTPWWKRALVFVLGVFQVVIGACIIASTAGALTGFGITMMMQGAKQCYDAIFRPEVLDDLLGYYGKVALTYAFSLAMSGVQGIKQLGTLTKNGFNLMKNTPIKDFMAQTFKTALTGTKMLPNVVASLNGGGKALLSFGLQEVIPHNLSNESKQEISNNPIQRVIKNSDQLKKKIQKFASDQNVKDRNISAIKQNFDKEMIKIIKNLLQQLDKTLIEEIKSMKLSEEQIYLIISKQIREGLKLPTSSSPQASKLVQIFKKNIDNKRLAQLFTQQIDLKKLMKQAIQNIKNHDKFKQIIEIKIRQMIIEAMKKVLNERTSNFQSKKLALSTELNYLQSNQNSNSISVGDFNNRVQAFNNSQAAFNKEVESLNKFIQQQYNKPEGWLFNLLKQKKAFRKDSRLEMSIVNQLPLHQYTKQALGRLQYVNSTLSFQQSMENAIYNEVVNFGQNIIDNIHRSQGDISRKIQQISKIIEK